MLTPPALKSNVSCFGSLNDGGIHTMFLQTSLAGQRVASSSCAVWRILGHDVEENLVFFLPGRWRQQRGYRCLDDD